MSRTPLFPNDPIEQINVGLPTTVMAEVAQLAAAKGMATSVYIRMVIFEYLRNLQSETVSS